MRTSDFLKTSEGAKYLLCDGSEVPSSYPKLRTLMTHTPDLRDRVPQGAGAYAVNTSINAGLPNITGWWRQTRTNGVAASGAISYWSEYGISSSYSGSYNGMVMYFNAAWSSPIYGNSNTVQPPALAVAFYIKAK